VSDALLWSLVVPLSLALGFGICFVGGMLVNFGEWTGRKRRAKKCERIVQRAQGDIVEGYVIAADEMIRLRLDHDEQRRHG
jgi:hypothetical protein